MTPDPIWEVIQNADTFENFKEKVLRPITLHNDVPEDIKAFTATVEKLLEHSYFEYDFIEVATTEAIFTLEKALKAKWTALHGEQTKKALVKLTDFFYEEGYFETNSIAIIDQLRHIRNSKVHNEIRSIGGLIFIKKIYRVFDLINDLYEDKDLRKERKEMLKELNKYFDKINNKGSILSINGKECMYLDYIKPIFVNNKTEKYAVLALVPLFNPKDIENVNTSSLLPTIELSSWQYDDSKFIGKFRNSADEIKIITNNKSQLAHTYWRDNIAPLGDTMLPYWIIEDYFYDLYNFHWRKIHQS